MQGAGLAADSHTILALLTAQAKAQDCKLSDITAVLGLMAENSIKRNTFICTGVINALRNCRSLNVRDRMHLGMKEYTCMKSAHITVTSETINSVICLLFECDEADRALEMLDEMSSCGITPTAHTYTLLIMIAVDQGYLDKANELEELKATMTYLMGRPSENSQSGRPMW